MTSGTAQTTINRSEVIDIEIAPHGLPGCLRLPPNPREVIVFAHGSGSSRNSARNVYVAEALRELGFATLVFDLPSEQEAEDRADVFDIPLLVERTVSACKWASAAN